MIDEERCGMCKFYKPSSIVSTSEAEAGFCHRHAPVASGVDLFGYPVTAERSWCGDWERRVPPRFKSRELIYGREPGQIESIGPYNDENYSAGLVGGKSILVSKEEGLYIFSRIQSEITRKVKNL